MILAYTDTEAKIGGITIRKRSCGEHFEIRGCGELSVVLKECGIDIAEIKIPLLAHITVNSLKSSLAFLKFSR